MLWGSTTREDAGWVRRSCDQYSQLDRRPHSSMSKERGDLKRERTRVVERAELLLERLGQFAQCQVQLTRFAGRDDAASVPDRDAVSVRQFHHRRGHVSILYVLGKTDFAPSHRI
jgi:hypothetical protein